GMWKDLLRLDPVSVHANFFALGGHSVLVFQVPRRLTETVGRDVPLVKLFHYPTIAALAEFLAGETVARPAAAVGERAQARHADVRRLRGRRETAPGPPGERSTA